MVSINRARKKRKAPKGRWIDDDRARVSCKFGVAGSWAAGWHTGVDLAVPGSRGQRVVWSMKKPAKVISAGYDKAYGHNVVVRGKKGKGKAWRFCHLASTSSVKVGQMIPNGGLIGKVGSSGNVTGPHLHLEWYNTGTPKYADVQRPPVWKGYR